MGITENPHIDYLMPILKGNAGVGLDKMVPLKEQEIVYDNNEMVGQCKPLEEQEFDLKIFENMTWVDNEPDNVDLDEYIKHIIHKEYASGRQ